MPPLKPPKKFAETLLIQDGPAMGVDPLKTPYFCNIGGKPVYFETLPIGTVELHPASSDPGISLGNEYKVTTDKDPVIVEPAFGEKTELTFSASQVEYKPMWVTAENVAAFGMTLVKRGQGIRIGIGIDNPMKHPLEQVDYEYGMFAGHWSPYREPNTEKKMDGTTDDVRYLLGSVGTDLECHDFPHVFASVDPKLPLVISVARFWPRLGKIYLADLWVPSGCALYVPPRSHLLGQPYLDLHGNRNSALACWLGGGQTSVQTQTMLQTSDSYFYWFWNNSPSIHPLLSDKHAK